MTAVLLLVIAIVQLADTDTEVATRISAMVVYAASSLTLLRNVRFSREAALVLLVLTALSALLQLALAIVGMTTNPVPVHTYLSLVVALLVLTASVPALVWLWRVPRRKA